MKLIFLVAFIIFFMLLGLEFKTSNNIKEVTKSLIGIGIVSAVLSFFLVLGFTALVDCTVNKEIRIASITPLVVSDQVLINKPVYLIKEGYRIKYWHYVDGVKVQDEVDESVVNVDSMKENGLGCPYLISYDTHWSNKILRELFGVFSAHEYSYSFYVPDGYVYWRN